MVKFASSAPSAGTAAYPSIAPIHVGWRLRKEQAKNGSGGRSIAAGALGRAERSRLHPLT